MQNKIVEEDNSISIIEMINIVKKYFWILVITTLVGGVILGSYAFFLATPKYKSTGAIMVQVKTGEEGSVNTVESQRLIQSTIDILTKIDLVPEKTSEKLNSLYGLEVPKGEIKENMGVSNSNNSLVIQITYTSKDEKNNSLILETIIGTLIDITDDVKNNMSKTLKGNISDLYVSDAKYYSPNKVLFTFIGMILGGTLGLITIFIYETVNSGYKNKEEVERELRVQVLGEIPEFEIK